MVSKRMTMRRRSMKGKIHKRNKITKKRHYGGTSSINNTNSKPNPYSNHLEKWRSNYNLFLNKNPIIIKGYEYKTNDIVYYTVCLSENNCKEYLYEIIKTEAIMNNKNQNTFTIKLLDNDANNTQNINREYLMNYIDKFKEFLDNFKEDIIPKIKKTISFSKFFKDIKTKDIKTKDEKTMSIDDEYDYEYKAKYKYTTWINETIINPIINKPIENYLDENKIDLTDLSKDDTKIINDYILDLKNYYSYSIEITVTKQLMFDTIPDISVLNNIKYPPSPPIYIAYVIENNLNNSNFDPKKINIQKKEEQEHGSYIYYKNDYNELYFMSTIDYNTWINNIKLIEKIKGKFKRKENLFENDAMDVMAAMDVI